MKKILIPLFIFCYLLDQATKWAVVRWIPYEDEIEIIPGFFNLIHIGNTGAAFGSMSDSNTFFIFLTIGVLIALAVFAWRGMFRAPLTATAITLLSAGALGNLTDRFLHGHVVDFLDFTLPLYGRWPAFNVADSCICIAAALLIFGAFFEKRQKVSDAA